MTKVSPVVWSAIAFVVVVVWQHVGRLYAWNVGTPTWILHQGVRASRFTWRVLGETVGWVYATCVEHAVAIWAFLRTLFDGIFTTLLELWDELVALVTSPWEAVRGFLRTFDVWHYMNTYPLATLSFIAVFVLLAIELAGRVSPIVEKWLMQRYHWPTRAPVRQVATSSVATAVEPPISPRARRVAAK